MTANISVFELFMQASLFVKLVMLTLAMMSILSWGIIFQRTIILSRAKKEALSFEDKFWSGVDLIQLYNEVKDHHVSLTGVEKIFYVGSTEFGRLRGNEKVTANSILEGTGRSMRVAVSQEVEALENHLPFLATVGSVSPYIGLLGTVWGIMHAFIALGEVKQATLSMVAPSISEALIATAVGLFAAIPAVVAYNRFSHQVSKLEHLYATFSEEFHGILHRQVVVRRD